MAEFLLNLDRDEELGRLFEQYSEEGSALWSYTRALLAFRRQGDTAESRRLLKMAKGANRHVLEYLLGRKLVPGRQPDYYTPGKESEAIVYAGQFLLGWKSTPGAVAWAGGQRQSVPPPPTSPSPLSLSPQGSRPNERYESDGQLLKLLKSLPTRQTVWEADCRPMPSWIQEGDQEVRPWWIVIAEEKHGTVLGQEIRSDPPPVALLWDTLVRTLQFPLVGKPYRPMEIYVRPGLGWESFEGSLDELGIRLVTTDHLDLVDFLQSELTQHLSLQRELGLLDVSGVTPKQLASLYESAALYFQEAPWRKLGYEVPIQIACNKFRSGPWYGIVMGQMGQTLGLTLYENLELLQRLLEGELSEEENLRFTVATTVIFGGPSEIPVADLDAAERHGWKVAGPDAYPWFFHKERGMTTHPPLAWQLELMEACLRTIPDFIQRRGQDDPTQEVMPVTLASGTLEMTLAWIID